jgi:hypothetical protein
MYARVNSLFNSPRANSVTAMNGAESACVAPGATVEKL